MASYPFTTSDASTPTQSSYPSYGSIRNPSELHQNQPAHQSIFGDGVNYNPSRGPTYQSIIDFDNLVEPITNDRRLDRLQPTTPVTPRLRPSLDVPTTSPLPPLSLTDPTLPLGSPPTDSLSVTTSNASQLGQLDVQASPYDHGMNTVPSSALRITGLFGARHDNTEATMTDPPLDTISSETSDDCDSAASSLSGAHPDNTEAVTADDPVDIITPAAPKNLGHLVATADGSSARLVNGYPSPATTHHSLDSPPAQAALLQVSQDAAQQSQEPGRPEEVITHIEDWNSSVSRYTYSGSPASSIQGIEEEVSDEQDLVGPTDAADADNGESHAGEAHATTLDADERHSRLATYRSGNHWSIFGPDDRWGAES